MNCTGRPSVPALANTSTWGSHLVRHSRAVPRPRVTERTADGKATARRRGLTGPSRPRALARERP